MKKEASTGEGGQFHKVSQNIPEDDAEQDRDNSHEAAEQNRTKNRDGKCCSRQGYDFGSITQVSGLSSFPGIYPAIPAATGTSSSPIMATIAPMAAGREHDVQPFRASHLNNIGQDGEDDAGHDKATKAPPA